MKGIHHAYIFHELWVEAELIVGEPCNGIDGKARR